MNKQLSVSAAVLHLAHAADPTPATQTTPAPHTDPGRPDRGTYRLTDSNGTACLMAYMGLQLNVSFTSASENKSTNVSGSCESESAVLQLTTDGQIKNLTFVFTLNTTSSKYHLSEVSLNVTWPAIKSPFLVKNSSLDYLRGSLGHSYMCRQEQTLTVTTEVSINTFQVQVQPFGLKGEQFGAAEECQLDEDDMLIPIIVGAALAGLVIIVLVAYLIGRKRSHAGYQTI
uniref:Lysosome-associated membrane glycoprotein 1 n=1 Tax=Oryzias melastigma TaxID=30732 RepID=A0A3B3BWV0_ORYME